VELTSYVPTLKSGSNGSTFTGPIAPFKHPRRNLVITAIQKLVLKPNSVLKTTLESSEY
jgi:hypothetical protein